MIPHRQCWLLDLINYVFTILFLREATLAFRKSVVTSSGEHK